jgi:hypothetical protein
MKIICDDIKSKDVCDIFKKHDSLRERYIKIENVELTKKTVSRRENVGVTMKTLEVDCFLVKGTSVYLYDDETTTGTRYVYEGDKLYSQILLWYKSQLRDSKLKELGI